MSPLYRVYRWCTAAKAEPSGWAATLSSTSQTSCPDRGVNISRDEPEQVEVVARNVCGEQEAAAGVPLQRYDGLGVRYEVRHHTLDLIYF